MTLNPESGRFTALVDYWTKVYVSFTCVPCVQAAGTLFLTEVSQRSRNEKIEEETQTLSAQLTAGLKRHR